MARIPDDFIQDLLHRLDVVEVVERYLPLKKAGQNYAACCPFHKEKSPSFTVSPTKQFYHCFGCGAHGTALSFVMEREGIGFIDAVSKLAESVGMVMPRAEQSPDAPRQAAKQASLVALNDRALKFYREQLSASERAKDYLRRRGLTGRIAARFSLGYAPEGWHPLAAPFSDYATLPGLAEVGLVIDQADSGRRYDRFRDRILFPIQDAKGAVIGFGGRVIDKGEPKYLNSPETPLFQKGRELYGLPQAREAIREHNRVLVVEGYMDVVALAQLGVEYAVATLGTACTPDHVKKLLRVADEVVFCFDGDAAGRRAAWRGLENSLPHASDAKRLGFLFLPPEHDPDSYIREYGKEAFEELISRDSLGLAAFLVRELSGQVDLGNDEGRARLIHLARPLVEQVQAPALGMLLRKKLGELTGLALDEVAQLITAASPQVVVASAAAPPPAQKARALLAQRTPAGRSDRVAVELDREVLQLLMFAPRFAHDVPQNLLVPENPPPNVQAILRVVDYVTEQASVPLAAHILAALRNETFFQIVNDAHQKAEEAYGSHHVPEAEVNEQWQGALRRFLVELERSTVRMKQQALELRLAQVGLAGLTDEEKNEWRRLALFR